MKRRALTGLVSVLALSCSGAIESDEREIEDVTAAARQIDDPGDDPSGGAGGGGPAPAPRLTCRSEFGVTRIDDRASVCQVGDCTLREAIMAANTCPGRQVIDLPALPGDYTLSLTGAEPDDVPNAAVGDLDITEAVTILGAHRDATVLSHVRIEVHHAGPDSTSFADFKLRFAGGTRSGAAISVRNGGFVTLHRMGLFSNMAAESGGALSVVNGRAHVFHTVFWNNRAGRVGGAIYAERSVLVLSNCQFGGGNKAVTGGAVFATALSPNNAHTPLEVWDSTFDGNLALADPAAPGTFAAGGAIHGYGVDARVDNTVFASNDSTGPGGALHIAKGAATLTRSRFQFNGASDGGAAAFDGDQPVRIEDSVIEFNDAAGRGAGIDSLAPLVVVRSSVSFNRALALPGAGAADGAGVFARGDAHFDSCTFFDNRADGEGGAIGTGVGTNPNPVRSVVNCTLSANRAQIGGAVSHRNGRLSIKNSTIVGNQALDAAALLARSTFPTLPPLAASNPQIDVNHSIVAHLSGAGSGALCVDEHFEKTAGAAAGILSNQFNLRGDDSCRFFAGTDVLAADPELAPLAENGGRTRTHALLATSPALNRGATGTGNVGDVACSPVDQRGVGRPQPTPGQPARCDIGAVEAQVR